MGKSKRRHKRPVKEKTLWKTVVDRLENGQSMEEASAEVPLAVRNSRGLLPKTIMFSHGQRKAIRRSYNG